jgi:DNA-binding IclR family transcriptional regulator
MAVLGGAVPGNARVSGVSVSSRLLSLLAAFDADHPQLALTEIARRAEVPLSTTHRLVAELVSWGALARRADGRYVIGRRLWDLGLLSPVQGELRKVASPYLHDIYAATGATVHLAVRDGTRVLYIDRLAGHASVPVVSEVGSRLPMHATGVGKVLLAYAPESVVTEVLENLERVTPYTVVDRGRLLRQLSAVRTHGFARTDEEMSLGACSVAVPVLGARNRVRAALGIVVPSLKRDAPRLVAALQVASAGITRELTGPHLPLDGTRQ